MRDSLGEPTRIAIVDCIEFNERFRYSDVAAELAFLTMELDLARRADLSRAFVTAYVEESGDEELRELLPFYACYRACVRGKVLAFQLDEPEVPAEQRIQAQAEAHAVFDLAAFYAGAPVRPTLLLVGGLMGSGKSTLAAALSAELGWQVISSDVTRKRLTRRDLRQHDTSAYGEGIYNQEWTARTYAAMLLDAQRILAQGRSVILDASFSRRRTRNAAARIGIGLGAQVMFAECVCPDAVALDRLRRRWASQPGEPQHNEKKGTAASVASDGRPELYSAQRASWEPFVGTAEPHVTHTLISTDQPLASSTNALFDALTLPRLVCWL